MIQIGGLGAPNALSALVVKQDLEVPEVLNETYKS